jgi:hypothetical protein
MVEVETLRVVKPIRLISKNFWRQCEIKDVELVFQDAGKQQPGQIWEYNLDIRGKLKSITVDSGDAKEIIVLYEQEIYHNKNDFERRLKEFRGRWTINEV